MADQNDRDNHVYLEVIHSVTLSLRQDEAFNKLAQNTDEYFETDNGRHCFLWKNISSLDAQGILDAVCGFRWEHFNVSVTSPRNVMYHNGYLSDLHVTVKFVTKKD